MADAQSIGTTRTNATNQAPKDEPAEPAKPAVEEDEDKGLLHFIWNSEKKLFCGRSGGSWLLITIFYLIFFASLAALFILFWSIAKISIDEKKPYRSNEDSLLCRDDAGPGLAIRPTTDRVENPASTIIWFGTDTHEEYSFWSGQLKMWFNKIPKTIDDNKHVKKCSEGNGPTDTLSCFIDPKKFGACGPMTDPATSLDFGYVRAEPCIILKLNRIYDWMPKPMSKASFDDQKDVPAGLKKYISEDETRLNNNVIVWCEGEHDHDKENLGPVEYFPGPYIPTYYFPFKNQNNFQTPFVAMQLQRPMPGTMISIVCKAYADNLKPSREAESGYIRFQVITE